jgi:hypothetical protein
MKNIMFIFLIGLLANTAGCSYYKIISTTPTKGDLTSYDTINVGWIDLGADKWKLYGYDANNKGNWLALIDQSNKQSMPEYLQRMLPNKKINVARSKNQEPAPNGLVIKFSDVEYAQRTSSAARVMFGHMGGSDTMDVTIHFIDGKTSKELKNLRVSIYSKSGGGFSDMTFEGRVNNSIYNLAYFMSKMLK